MSPLALVSFFNSSGDYSFRSAKTSDPIADFLSLPTAHRRAPAMTTYSAGDKKIVCVLFNFFSSLTMTVNESLSYHNASMTTKANTHDLQQEIADLESRLHNAKIRLESSSSSFPVSRSDKVSPWSHGHGSNGRDTRSFLHICVVAQGNSGADHDLSQWTSSAQRPSMHCSSYQTLRSR